MVDIPFTDSEIPYYNETDLQLGLVSTLLFTIISGLISSIRSPFDFGFLLENLLQNIGFLNELIGVSLQSPTTAPIMAYISFALTVTLTILFYDVSFGKGLRRQTRYYIVFLLGFLLAIPYFFIADILDLINGLLINLLKIGIVYLYHVSSIKIGRTVADR